MTGIIGHRGPDADGFYTDDFAWLGHARLSIIDLATGQQPMTNEDESLWIVYNGEIFNHSDVRPKLEAAGHRYRSRSDTETILHAYEEYGAACVRHFRGMFAFAIWDKAKRRLFCARDRLGIKPLYYFWDGNVFAFASEIKSLLTLPQVSARFEEGDLGEHLAFGYTSSEKTLFAGIRKLMPGHTLTLDLRSPRPEPAVEPYWNAPAPQRFESRSEEDWVAECRARLEETVRMRLMSDVPLGMFLSGGVDSSAIAALMKRMVSGPVKTFAVGYAEAAYSELSYAREVAESIGTDHHEVVIGFDDFFGALPRLVWHEDEPITWPSSVSLYFVAKLAAEQVKVVLTGEGSDELFGGYARYAFYNSNYEWAQRYQMVPGFVRNGVRGLLENSRLLSGELRRKALHTFLGRRSDIRSLYLDNFYCAFSDAQMRPLLRAPSGDPYDAFLRYWGHSPSSPLLTRMLYADQKTYLVELLMKQDQMSMACSIESRVPFLDHTFVEFAASVPVHMKIRGREGKYIIKRAVEDLLPREIIYRRKMGFPTPLRAWLMESRASGIFDYLQDGGGLLAAYVDHDALAELIGRHRSGQEDATDRIWRLLNLQIWGDLHITGRGMEAASSVTAAAAV